MSSKHCIVTGQGPIEASPNCEWARSTSLGWMPVETCSRITTGGRSASAEGEGRYPAAGALASTVATTNFHNSAAPECIASAGTYY